VDTGKAFRGQFFGRIAAAGMALGIRSAPAAALADHYKVGFSTTRSDDDGALRKARIEATLTPDRGRIKMTRAAADTGSGSS